jgi:hypothetical protein
MDDLPGVMEALRLVELQASVIRSRTGLTNAELKRQFDEAEAWAMEQPPHLAE